jgi:hypothetical protein
MVERESSRVDARKKSFTCQNRPKINSWKR